ncbi:tumor necrosis factor-like isoform X2 [Haliotis cracherodii]|uniref:tumor necrosis factor-like isoform X2 n=1 Tax=Haliotis cracherodii TaxID=6455 RepID=UPI0039EB9F2A
MKRIVKGVCSSLLVLNIAVGIAVICRVVSSIRDTGMSNTGSLKQEISKMYEERVQLMNNNDYDDHKRKGTTGNETPIRIWVPFVGPGRRLLYNGMRYENGSIIIPATGVYVVYSHVKFYTERNRRGDTETDFHHSIMRYNALEQTSTTALADAVSENKNDIIDGASLEYSSDIHGLLQLNAGDQLVVKVSRINPLRHDRDWHYFGVYMI